MNRAAPRPVVIFAQEGDAGLIRDALSAGVVAYVADGLDPNRIKPVIEVARARFQQNQALRRELEDATRRLSEGKVVERAKGLLMRARGLSEEEAYHRPAQAGDGARQDPRRRRARCHRHGTAAALNLPA
jgi:response regulator NasT